MIYKLPSTLPGDSFFRWQGSMNPLETVRAAIMALRDLKNHTHVVGNTSLKGRKMMSAAQARRCRGAPIYE